MTRPRAQSLATARLLKQKGYRSLIGPVSTIEAIRQPRPDLADVRGIILTSANGAIGLDERMRDMPVFAVGQATAAAARRKGARHVLAGQKDGPALARLIQALPDAGQGLFLHLAGLHIREGLAEALAEAKIGYRPHPVYQAQAASLLSKRVQAAWQDRQLLAVMLYSPRAAGILRNLLEAAGLLEHVDGTMAICMSKTVAECIEDLGWKAVRVATAPNQDAMLACLE